MAPNSKTHDMNRPQRIQLRRTKGWRKPEGAIVVARPSKWGNPYRVDGEIVYDNGGDCAWMSTNPNQAAVDLYKRWLLDSRDSPLIVSIIDDLAGHDLACWCPLDQPCHADVLLELANS